MVPITRGANVVTGVEKTAEFNSLWTGAVGEVARV